MFGFEIGDQVELSKRGLMTMRQHHKKGEVVGFQQRHKYGLKPADKAPEIVKVQWECNLVPSTIHHTFIQKTHGV